MEAENEKKNAIGAALEDLWDSDSSNEEGSSMEQQFSVDLSKKSLIEVKVKAVVTPNEFIVNLESNSDVLDRIEADLGNNWHQEVPDWENEKQPLKCYTPVIIATSMMGSCDETLGRTLRNFHGEMKSDEMEYVRGTVLRSLTTEGVRFYEVFLSDFGEIRNVMCEGVVKMTNEDLLKIPPAYALVKIPGLVARKRMDKIPGLAKMNIHASSWSQEAYSDFESWLSKHHTILLDKLKSDTKDVWYGDLLGTLEQDGSKFTTNQTLSSHLIELKHGFIDYTVLSRINEDDS